MADSPTGSPDIDTGAFSMPKVFRHSLLVSQSLVGPKPTGWEGSHRDRELDITRSKVDLSQPLRCNRAVKECKTIDQSVARILGGLGECFLQCNCFYITWMLPDVSELLDRFRFRMVYVGNPTFVAGNNRTVAPVQSGCCDTNCSETQNRVLSLGRMKRRATQFSENSMASTVSSSAQIAARLRRCHGRKSR